MQRPKSKFVRELIKTKSYRKTGEWSYICDLTTLECTILYNKPPWTGTMSFYILRNKYPKEFKTLCDELNPSFYKKWAKKRPSKWEDPKNLNKLSKMMDEKDRKLWLKFGGKP